MEFVFSQTVTRSPPPTPSPNSERNRSQQNILGRRRRRRRRRKSRLMDYSSSKGSSIPCSPRLSLISSLLLALLLGFGLINHAAEAFAVPFRPKDVLPILPRQISWPVMNNIHSAVDLLPSFVGSIAPGNTTIRWQGSCFLKNEARVELTQGDREEDHGGAILSLKVFELIFFYYSSLFC